MTGQVAQVSGWQITSTIATASAVVIALTVAVANSLQRRADELRRRREEEARALAQARLVITATGNQGVQPFSDDDASGLDARRSVMEFPFANHGDRPVLDVYGEVWPAGVAVTDRPVAVHAEVVLAGQHLPLRVQVESAPEHVQVSAWRVRWTDADGRRWYRDRFPQEVPERFTGAPPHRY